MKLFLVFLILFNSCTHKSNIKKIDEGLISEFSKLKLDEAKTLLKEKKYQPALNKLGEMNDGNLNPIEKSLKYNLKGVSLFEMDKTDKALLNFEIADKYAPEDTQLFSQIQLNMASGHYKLNQVNDLKSRIEKIDRNQLDQSELKKYAQLLLAYSHKVKNQLATAQASILLMTDAKSSEQVTNSSYYAGLKSAFWSLSESQRVKTLEDFSNNKNYVVAHLAKLEIDFRLNAGDKKGAEGVLDWLRSEYGGSSEIQQFIKDYETRDLNSKRMNPSEVGIILPLTGEKQEMAIMALSGIETGFKIFGLQQNIKLRTKDSQNSPAMGAQSVAELVQEHHVLFIIGGLSSENAKAEYLEAKKWGVPYLSLSSVHLPKEDKNHSLIEVNGSTQSQVEALLSDEMIKKFGTRLGVLYPESDAGKAYLDEIWRKVNQKALSLKAIGSFPKGSHDLRDTALSFLGLKYPRERAEELKIVDDVYSFEKSSIRRVQNLPPVIDFDWLFLAATPVEAIQMIPTLGYYDAHRLKIVGGPSWANKLMIKEQKNLGTLYFVGDYASDLNQEVLNQFQQINSKPAGLIEIFGLDAMKLGEQILRIAQDASGRDDLDLKLKNQGKLIGLTSSWDLGDGVWLKKINQMSITRGEVVKLFNEP